jgi:hypothetical protein
MENMAEAKHVVAAVWKEQRRPLVGDITSVGALEAAVRAAFGLGQGAVFTFSVCHFNVAFGCVCVTFQCFVWLRFTQQ